MKRTINLSLESQVYQAIKQQVPNRQISPLVNSLLKDYLKKQNQRKLATAYQDFANNKKVHKELEIWQEAAGDGVDE